MTQPGWISTYLQQKRLPLLLPVSAWVAALALARSDVISPFMAAILLAVLLSLLLALRCRTSALLLLLAAVWGVGDLLLDASRVAVDSSWLATPTSSTARVQSIQQMPAFMRLQLYDIRRDDGVKLPGKALLYIYRGHSADSQPVPLLRAGDSIHFTARWHTPHNNHNPGAFDYRAWCFDRHIALLGVVRGHVQLLEHSASLLQRGRERISHAIAGLPDTSAGILRAVLLGERTHVPIAVNAAFSATGTAHLLAISGMHVGMAAAWVMALIWWLLTRRELWIIKLPVRNIAMLGGLLAAMSYALIAGWPLPAVRATMMLAAGVLAWSLSARNEPLNILLAALALILLSDPAAISSLSLWMSFTATAALLLWAVRIKADTDTQTGLSVRRLIAAGKALVWLSLIATLATLPITLPAFGRLPVYSIPANLVLVPLYGLLVMPLGLLAELAALLNLPHIAGVCMQLAGMAVQAGVHFLDWLVTLPAGSVWAAHPPLWLGVLYLAGMLLAGWRLLRRRHAQAAGLALLVIGLYTVAVLHERDVDAPLWVVWDAGQGAASTLLLPGKRVIVVDVPGKPGSRFNGGTIVASGLRNLGFTHVDVLILSHAQSDHLGGAMSLLRSVNHTREVWLPDVPAAHRDARVHAIIAQAEAQGTRVRWLARGDTWQNAEADGKIKKKDHAVFSILWPPRGFAPANDNNTSLVVSVTLAGGAQLLWPGDIEAASERQLLKTGLPPVGAMLIPHHGSRTSSTSAFVSALAPGLAVAQTAPQNRYGFPVQAIIARYKAIGAHVFNTADGAVLVRWRQAQPHAYRWSEQVVSRREQARYWWHRLNAK